MAQAVAMPKFGQTVEEATIVRWHKKEGDEIRKGDIIFEIETDKAVLEVESFYEGTLLKILVGEQVPVPVSTVVAYVGKKGEPIPASPPPAPRAKAAPVVDRPAVREAVPIPMQAVSAAAPQPGRLLISPRARALAKGKVIDPAGIAGSGPGGRIVVEDVEAYLRENRYDELKISPAAKKLAAAEGLDILKIRRSGESVHITMRDVQKAVAEKPSPMSRMRQVIARRLTESFTTIPHFYVSVSVDMTGLLAFKQELKEKGGAYSVTDFILEAAILSLREFPILNSATDGNTVKRHSSVDLGMAVGLEDGLVVPVIRDAQDLNMRELHDVAQELAARARDGKLAPDEMTGSTFTVSNMGMLNVEDFIAIINPGESAILAVAGTKEKPVAVDGAVRIRQIMRMTLSADHRIVDGAMAAAFINAVKTRLEDVELWKSLT